MRLKQTKRALHVLRSANKALEKATLEQELLDEICRIAIDVGGYRFAWVGYAQDDAEKSVRFMASAGHHSDYLKEIHISWGDNDTGNGPAGIAIKTNTANVVQHIQHTPHFAPWREKAQEYGYESVIALPLSWRGDTFGCLAILSDEPDAFDEGESSLLQELTASVSYGINALRTGRQRDLAEKALRTERDTQKVLRRILSLSLEKSSLEEKLNRALALLFDIPWLALERKGAVFLAEENSNTLRLVAKQHVEPALVNQCSQVPFGHCLCGKAAESGELVFQSNHENQASDITLAEIPAHGHYCQPIRSANGVIGVLNLYVDADHQPAPFEEAFLSTVADTLASLIERQQAELAQKRLITILEATPDLVTITDTKGKCLYCNDGAWNMLKDTDEHHHCSNEIMCHYPANIAHRIREEIYPTAIKSGVWEGELTLNRADGSQLPVSQLVMAHKNEQGKVEYLSTVARDISDRKLAEISAQSAALREKNFANSVINNLPGIFYLIDEEGRLLRWNSNLEQSLGYSGDQMHHMNLHDIIAPDDAEKVRQSCKTIIEYGAASIEVGLVNRSGNTLPYYVNGIRIDGADTGATILGIGIDISYRLQLEKELVARATTDPLTGAYNRLRMEEAIEQEIQTSARDNTPFAVAMFDIDHFKRVNDNHGHDIGDNVLRQVVAITRQQLRDTDLLARWGGEEFIIIANDTNQDDMQKIAERVRIAIASEEIDPVGKMTVSFGVGEYQPGERMTDLLKRVDDSLYHAKKAGRNQVHVAL